MRRAVDDGPQLFEWSCRDARGEALCVELNLKRGRIAGRDRLLAIARDVTDRKAAELEVQQARDLALESGRLKSEFLANMSHEIRTPLHVIFGMNDLLREETSLTSDQRELVESVHRNAAGLIQIVDDILDLSRIEAGKLELHLAPCAVGPVVREALEVYAQRARAKGLEVSADVPADLPASLIGDAGRLRQILLNLIGNAIKFTEAGSVAVRVAVDQRTLTGLKLRFSVTDTGIGIPPDQRHRLFRSFSQVDGSMTRQFGGIGLGLAISHQLVELMGGEIGVESEPGRGSTFWFTVPLDRAPAIVPRVPRRVAAR
jgi:two-component system sensor histidine kinase/response regulator